MDEQTDNVLTYSVSTALTVPLGLSERRGTAFDLGQGILTKQQKVPLCLKLNILVKSMPAPVFCFIIHHETEVPW